MSNVGLPCDAGQVFAAAGADGTWPLRFLLGSAHRVGNAVFDGESPVFVDQGQVVQRGTDRCPVLDSYWFEQEICDRFDRERDERVFSVFPSIGDSARPPLAQLLRGQVT